MKVESLLAYPVPTNRKTTTILPGIGRVLPEVCTELRPDIRSPI